MPQRLRIFISSPSDVPNERLRAGLIIDKLSQDYGRYFAISSYRWEHEAMLASKHFQDAIEPPSAFDIVVLIVWSRLGTPLPENTAEREYRGMDGRAPVTGTEWEYEEALKSAREKKAPDLLAFRNVSPALIDPRDQEAQANAIAQFNKLNDFWRRHFADRGVFLAAYDEFRTLEEFAERLEQSLRKLIERRIKNAAAGNARLDPIWLGEPFRGLQAYEFEHAPIFFGRDAAVTKATEQLASNAQAGLAFLLVSGASGSGKSSLVKAGVVPKLMKPQRISGMAFVRRTIFRPASNGVDVFLGLAKTLTSVTEDEAIGLPELLTQGQSAEQLADFLRGNDPGFLFANALGHLTEVGRASGRLLSFEELKLILVVDQLEELFTTSLARPDDQRRFIGLLAALARSSAVWVIVTIRADFWQRAAEIPELIALAEGTGRIDLSKPSAAELAGMISKPAQAAGLSFEAHPQTGLGLDAVLAEDAAAAPGVLPLLSFTLDELSKDAKARGEMVLTHASYEALGGLEGAIAKRADETLSSLPAAAQMMLPRILRALTTVSGPSEQATVGRPAPLGQFAENSPARVLIDGFVAARLLVAAGEAADAPNIRLAHEALIGRWQRARDQLAADRRDLETRALIERQFARWSEASGRERRLLLLRNPDLANAIDVAKRWGDEFDQNVRLYVDVSYRQFRLRQRLIAVSAAAFALIAILAGAAANVAYRAKQTASEAAVAATQRLQEALLNESRFLTQAAEKQLKDSSYDLALLLGLQALPKDSAHPERPLWSPAVDVFQDIFQQDRLRAVFSGLDVKFSPDSSYVLTWSDRGAGAVLSDVKTGRQVAYLDSGIAITSPPHREGIIGAEFSNDGRLLTYASNKTLRIWNAKTGASLGELSGRRAQFSPDGKRILVIDTAGVRIWDGTTSTSLVSQDNVDIATFDSDGGRVFIGFDDGSARILDAKTGATLARLKASGEPTSAHFSTDGASLLTTWDDHKARMWDASTGTLRFELDGVETSHFSPDCRHMVTTGTDLAARIWDSITGQMQLMLKDNSQVIWASYSPDGKHIVTSSYDYAVTVWNATSGEIEYVLRGTEDRPLANISEPVFSSDGRLIAAAFNGGEVRIWDARSYTFREPGQSLKSAVLSPNGQLVVTVTSGKNDASLWDVNRGTLVLTLKGHEAPINSAAFNPDGNLIITGSNDGTARIWDAHNGDCIKVLSARIGPISDAEYTRDGQSVAILTPARYFEVWNPLTEEVLTSVDGVIAWSSDARRVVLRRDRTVEVFDFDSKNSILLKDLWNMDDTVYAKFSPDETKIVTYGPRLNVWDARTGADLLTLPRMNAEHVNFSPDGRRIIVVQRSRDRISIWGIDSKKNIALLQTDDVRAEDAAFSPNGELVLTGQDDGTARLWDSHTGKRLAVLNAGDYVEKVQFSPNGQAILTKTATAAELWGTFPLAAEDARAYASLIAVRDFTKDERKQFFLLAQDEPKSRFEADDPSVTDCDRLAANPMDPKKRAFGVKFENIKDEAVAACRTALAQNPDDPRLLYQLGRVLQKQGVFVQALDMYQRSALKDYGAAYNNLGALYQSGTGVEQNISKAIDDFQRAFQNGFLYAGYTISGLYWTGKYVAQDHKTSIEWLSRAASEGDPHSNGRLAYLYEQGEGVQKDLNRALFHWALADKRFQAAEVDGILSEGTGAYARTRRIALSRNMRWIDVIKVAKEVFDWSPHKLH
jgi:WD40 repeat protein